MVTVACEIGSVQGLSVAAGFRETQPSHRADIF